MGIWNWGFWNVWARAYRNARALSVALTMFAAIAVMGVVRCREASDPVVESRREEGVLVSAARNAGENVVLGTIALAAGDTVQLWLAAPYPEPGGRVPLLVDVRRSGERVYAYDAGRYLTGN